MYRFSVSLVQWTYCFNVPVYLRQSDIWIVLNSDHRGIHPERRMAPVFHCHLRLAVRAQIGKFPFFADLGKTVAKGMSQRNALW